MAENKAEIKVEDKADYTENIAPEYKNYSSVARKPFATKDDKKDDNHPGPRGGEKMTEQVQGEAPKAPIAPKAPSADSK